MSKKVELKNIDLNFYSKKDKTEVFKNLNIDFKSNKITAIIGPSGCGKSTILNLISGLQKPNNGEVVCDYEIGYMFQKDNLLEWLNVLDNVTIGLKINKQITKEKINEAISMLKKYELDDFIYKKPSELSGGMRQRVALIRSLVSNPTLLLLDEPFSALDAQTKISVSKDIYSIIKELQLTTILVTHDISESISFADEIIVLTNRPTTIKNKYIIKLDTENDSPIEKRLSKDFKNYFDLIWNDLL